MNKGLLKIGRNIVARRKELGMTQEDLAGLAEMDRSYISEIENGRKNMSLISLMRIAEALNAKPRDFFF